MKTGLSLTDLAKKIEANKELKYDLVAPASSMRMVFDGEKPLISIPEVDQQFPILSTAHDQTIEQMRGLTGGEVKGDPAKAVEVLAKKVGANETERGGILASLIKGGDLSAWGLLNAVTHQAHSAVSYDRSMDFVDAGGKLLTMPKSEWKEVLEAA